MRRAIRLPGAGASMLCLAVFCLLWGSASSAQAARKPVTAMSYNIFQGSELSHTLSTTSLSQLAGNVAADYNNVVASNIPARARALAAEIKANRPDLVGLQEAALWRTGPSDPSKPITFCNSAPCTATTVSYDFVHLLVKALGRQGAHYRAVAITNNFDVQATGDFGSAGKKDVRLTDRVAILARKGVKVSNVQTQNYTASDAVTVLGVPIVIKDGWASVDAKVAGKSFRFITTHLDGANTSTSSAVRAAEAQEIINGPAKTTMPVAFTCDCNVTPDQATHQALAGSGLSDTWAKLHPHQNGFSCCHRDNPANPEVSLADPHRRQGINKRLDYVWASKQFSPKSAKLVGLSRGDRTKTRPPLWPSDHLGLVAVLNL